MPFSLSKCSQISLCVFPEGVVHESSNMVLMTIGLFDVASRAVVTPLRLLDAKHDLYILH
jgi:hypothetical protein